MPYMSRDYINSKEGKSKILQYILSMLHDKSKSYSMKDINDRLKWYYRLNTKYLNNFYYHMENKGILKIDANPKDTFCHIQFNVIKALWFIHSNPAKVVVKKHCVNSLIPVK